MIFYVYRYRDPRSHRLGVPIYIGKGTVCAGKHSYSRAYNFKRKNSSNELMRRVIKKIIQLDLIPTIEIVRVCKTEKQAFRCEKYWIKKHGRLNIGTGTLLNLTDGGEGMVGFRFTRAQRTEIATTNKKTWGDNPELGQAVSERTKKLWKEPGYREKRSAENAAYWADPINRKRQSKHGKRLSAERWCNPEEHVKLAKQSKERWADPKYKVRACKSLCVAAKVRANKPSWRKAHSKRIKKVWQDPVWRAAYRGRGPDRKKRKTPVRKSNAAAKK